EGVIKGTIGYMSPEQVRGRPVDSRSDLFSFGVVLHEMLAGGRAFHRGSSADTLSAILKEEPAELPDSITPLLREIVRRCLAKDTGQRFQSAADLAFSLRTVVLAAPKTAAPPMEEPGRNWALAVFAFLLAAVAGATWFLKPTPRQAVYDI